MVKKLEGLAWERGVELSQNDKTALALVWRYFVGGALGGAFLAVVWNKGIDFWTVLGGATFGVVIVGVFMLAVACDVVKWPGRG